jgi:hypothetical protein
MIRGRSLHPNEWEDAMPASNEQEAVRKFLRDALVGIPATIETALFNPRASATSRLKWTERVTRLLQDPTGRPVSDIDIENRRKAAHILKAAVPALETIRDEHRSERLRKTADRYLRYIASL